jgi:hypothetical protein
MAQDTKTRVIIDVTVQGGHGSAPDAEARCGDDVTWAIDGDIGPDDEVIVGPFNSNSGGGSPMKNPEGKRKGKGNIDDSVKSDARPDRYHYEITIHRVSGAASVIDPEIQIKP